MGGGPGRHGRVGESVDDRDIPQPDTREGRASRQRDEPVGGDETGGPGHPELEWEAFRPRERRVLTLLLAMVVFAAVGVGAAVGYLNGLGTSPGPVSPRSTTIPRASSPAGSVDSQSLARRVDPTLVDVNTEISAEGLIGAGTGMVLSASGLVLTNNHVIEEASSISVTDVGNGRTYPAVVRGYDRSLDVAVLQLKGASGLSVTRVQTTPAPTLGEPVVAFGNAEGVGGTPSGASGSITGLNQSISAADAFGGQSEELSGLIEISAPIVPGDSGGALVNADAAVIGMVTAGTEQFHFATGPSEGYAIPIASALAVASEIERGRASATVHVGATAMLGIVMEEPLGAKGAGVAGVIAGGPAATAGLVTGDTIVAIGGRTVDSPDALTNALLALHPGQSVRVTYEAAGHLRTVTIRLANGPAQ